MADSAIVALIFSSISVTVTVVTAAVWIRGQFGALGERLAKAELETHHIDSRLAKLEDAREHEIRAQLGRAGII